MSRRPTSELEFGSDSFLDIIANIVGILIILIVIAGLRAARAPVPAIGVHASAGNADSTTRTGGTLKRELQPGHPTKVLIPPPKIEPFVEVERPSPPQPLLLPPVPTAVPVLRDDLLAKIRGLRARIADLTAARKQLESQLRQAETSQRSLASSARRTSAELRGSTAAAKRLHSAIAALESDAARSRTQIAELRRRYDEAARKPQNVLAIQHKLTPVSQQVSGKEIHFRILEGQVALVPIEELVGRLRDEVIRRKNWLLKFPTQRGTIGPVNGFEMHYAVQRQMSSTLDELRTGYGRIQIALQGWKIEATSELQPETADAALQPGSKFLQEIRVADSTATVTFWVYPDSFAAFRKLQGAVHREGLRVAARPLPFGIPIAGSPQGSRSSGQ